MKSLAIILKFLNLVKFKLLLTFLARIETTSQYELLLNSIDQYFYFLYHQVLTLLILITSVVLRGHSLSGKMQCAQAL